MKIAIVGLAPSTYSEAPFHDSSWKIWTIGQKTASPRFDRWFEMHTMDIVKEISSHTFPNVIKFFQSMGDKLVVGHPHELCPAATIYPIEKLKPYFGTYFTSTIAYMIALAIHEGAEEIGLWGVDMLGDGEYSHQRPCCEHMLGIAKGKGIKLTIPDKSPVLRSERMYGLENCQMSLELTQMQKELEKAVADAETAALKAEFYRGQQAMLLNIKRRYG